MLATVEEVNIFYLGRDGEGRWHTWNGLSECLSRVIRLEELRYQREICSATGWRWELREEFVREEQLEVIQA